MADSESTPIKRSWLLSNEDFTDLTNVNAFNEWALFILWDNGITCPDDAYTKLQLARFEHGNPDCSFCGQIDEHYVLRTDQWNCKKCRRTFSVTSGTYLDNSKLEAHIWWRFCYLVGEMGITNSHTISKDLGVTQKTAWYMLDTLRTARKETSATKFVNGSEVLAFNNLHEVIDVLVKIKRDKDKPVPDKSDFLKKIYDLILSQTIIKFKEVELAEPSKTWVYKYVRLQFRHADDYIEILKKTRIKKFANEGLLGEEKYLLCTPSNRKAKHIKRLYANLLRKIFSPKAVFQSPPHPPTDGPVAPLVLENSLLIPEIELELSPVVTEKRCTRIECQQIKPASEFNKAKSKDGLASYCRECGKLVSREFVKRRKEEREKRRQEKLANTPIVILPPVPIINSEIEKQCRKKTCLKIKPHSEFYKGSSKDGLSSYCKECCTEASIASAEKYKLRKPQVQEIVSEPVSVEPAIVILEPALVEPEIIIPVPIPEPELPINPLTEKRCSRKKCRKVKPLSEFHKGLNADGLQSWCKSCIIEKSHERRPKKIKPSPNYGDEPKKNKPSVKKPSPKKISEDISKEEARKIHQRNQVLTFLDLKNR